MLWILIFLALVAISYTLLTRPHKYWIKRGVKQGNPAFLIGDSWGMLMRKQSLADMVQMIYDISPNSRYCGIYQFLTPTLVIRDPDLIKQITVKDFDHFVNHFPLIPEDFDALITKNLFLLKDQKWRDMRNMLSPAFTGSKMKYMFSLISESGEQFVQHFLKQKKDVVTLEMKDTFTRFTNDVIANTAFGVKCDSLGEPNNEFFLMGKETTDFGGFWKTLKFFGFLLIPQIFRLFKVSLFSKEVGDFFTNLVKNNIASREKHGIVRPDMINLLMEARNNSTEKVTDVDITAQAMIFFLAGFDTVSNLMCFTAHELAVNPDIQEKLRREVDETFQNCNGQLTYEALMGMKYMDMVVSETLRLWPPSPAGDRVCTKPYTIDAIHPDEKPLHLEKNAILSIPIYAIQRDPHYFPEPNRFDPERFSDENRVNIKPYTYLPFGAGPRLCIGSRFALLETKALFFYLLSHFQIVAVKQTQIPLRLKKSLSMSTENGFWLGIKRRQPNVQH